jgi:hypothetical protein
MISISPYGFRLNAGEVLKIQVSRRATAIKVRLLEKAGRVIGHIGLNNLVIPRAVQRVAVQLSTLKGV